MLLTKDAKAIEPALAEARAVALVRDLVNTPAEDMGPAALEAEAESARQGAPRQAHRDQGRRARARVSRWSTRSAAPPRAATRRA